MSKFWLIALLVLSIVPLAAYGQISERKDTIKGTVVAEGVTFDPCGWHVCGLSLIVRLDKPNRYKHVVVHVTYMDDRSKPLQGKPTDLVKFARRWKFTATSENDNIRPLQQYLKFINMETGKDERAEFRSPAWALIDGAESEKLPFGKSVPNYNVDVGAFKPLK